MSSLNPRHRVGRIIAGPLRLHGFDGIDGRVEVALDQVGLPRGFRHRYPHELSGGQRQRVGIARAIALQPDFILADEIVSGLDVSSQAQVLNLLERLVRDLGLTLAFISHDLSVVRRLCSQIVVLHQGLMVERAPTPTAFRGAAGGLYAGAAGGHPPARPGSALAIGPVPTCSRANHFGPERPARGRMSRVHARETAPHLATGLLVGTIIR